MPNLSGKYVKCTSEDDDGEFMFRSSHLVQKMPEYLLESAFKHKACINGCMVVKDSFGHYQLESKGSPKHVEA